LKVQELIQIGREKIIQLAIERVKGSRPDFEVGDLNGVRVHASDRTIRVTVGIGFGAEGVKKHMGFSISDNVYIQESEGHYEVTCSHGAEGGAECYRIDKGTGASEMIWHEHPMPMEMPLMTGADGNVIEEEEFEEILE